MKCYKILSVAVVGLVLIFGIFYFSPAQRFKRLPSSDLAAFARACDAILVKYNAIESAQNYASPLTRDLPEPIGNFDVKRIVVSSNSVWMFIGPGKIGGFSVTWQREGKSGARGTLTMSDGIKDTVLLKNARE